MLRVAHCSRQLDQPPLRLLSAAQELLHGHLRERVGRKKKAKLAARSKNFHGAAPMRLSDAFLVFIFC